MDSAHIRHNEAIYAQQPGRMELQEMQKVSNKTNLSCERETALTFIGKVSHLPTSTVVSVVGTLV